MKPVLRIFLSVYHLLLDCITNLLARFRGKERGPPPLSPHARGQRRSTDSRSDVTIFEVTLKAKDEELERARREVETLGREVESLKRKVEEERHGAKKTGEEHEGALADVEGFKSRLAQAELEAKRAGSRAAELQRANTTLEKEKRDTLALLETRTAELKEAQTFLTKADNIADSEVQVIIEHLNSKIFQTAASMSDSPQFRYGSQEHVEIADRAVLSLEKAAWLGPHLLTALRSIDHTEDPVLVQTALQTCMTTYVRWLATSWDLGLCDSQYLLYNIYSRVRERGAYLFRFS